MITRDDTINAWNSYIATKQHHDDTSTVRSQAIASHERRADRWEKVFIGTMVTLVVSMIALLVEGNIFYQATMWVGIIGALGLTVSISSGFISEKNSDAVRALQEKDDEIAAAYHTFLDTTVGYVRTLGHTILNTNYSNTSPYITTAEGIITIAFVPNSTAPELLLHGRIIQSAYRDTSNAMTGMGGQRILTT